MSQGALDDGNTSDGGRSKGRRELSTSKRAAQNRAAQVCLLCACFLSILTLPARLPPAQGRIHQATQGPGQGVRAAVRAIQDPSDRELPAARLHHQLAVASTRDPGRDPTGARWCRPQPPTYRACQFEPTASSTTATPGRTAAAATVKPKQQQQWRTLRAADWRATDGGASCCCRAAWSLCPPWQTSQLRRPVRLRGEAPEDSRITARSAAPFTTTCHIPESECL